MNRATDGWEPCRPGQLLNAAGCRRARRRAATVRAVGITASAVLLLVTFALALRPFERASDAPCGGLTCQEVRALLPKLDRGELDLETTHRLQTHLGLCRSCRALIRQTFLQKTHVSGPRPGTAAKWVCSTQP